MSEPLPAATHMGTVTLTSVDAEALAGFYERIVGLEILGRDGDTISLGAPGAARPLVRLVGDPDAPKVRGTTGLFHLAVLLPDRVELGHAVRRVVEGGWRLTGASDHFVSEALYLRDPEGNGIEIYRDLPRADWSWRGEEVQMGTVALDLQSVVDEAAGDSVTRPRVGRGTTIGHVHLSVADLAPAEAFYRETVGFDLTVRYADQASFLSAGGYHHHLGMNIWGGHGLVTPPPGVVGLRAFEIVVPDEAGRRAVVARASVAGSVLAEEGGVAVLRDPAGLLAHVTA